MLKYGIKKQADNKKKFKKTNFIRYKVIIKKYKKKLYGVN